jgi:outer membrane protein
VTNTAKRSFRFQASFRVIGWFLGACLMASGARAEFFSLDDAVHTALTASLAIKVTQSDIEAAEHLRMSSRTAFYPTFNATYEYVRHDEERRSLGVLVRPIDEYRLATSIVQPVFTGFANRYQYEISELSVDLAKNNQTIERHRIIFDAKEAYFSVLKTRKLVAVAEQAVSQLTAQREDSRNFYEVGIIPYNDLLKAEVELANVQQDRIVAQNNFELAESNFNTLLRRPIHAAVELQDVLAYQPFDFGIAYCLDMAARHRPEIVYADLQVDVAEKQVKLARKDLFPRIDLQGTYFLNGREFYVSDSGEGIIDPSGWDISATATWDFWQWGRTQHDVKEKLSRLAQTRFQQSDLMDRIQLEVKRAYLRTKESEQNITAVDKAVEQAKENFRITKERFKEQMATNTDVLDAQTLLTRTMTNYYNALYDFQISKASLYRAMGQEVLE